MKKQILIAATLFFLVPAFLCAADKPLRGNTTTAVQDSGYLSKEYKALETPIQSTGNSVISFFQNLAYYILMFLIVILLIYILARFAKYFYVKANIPVRSENVVNVIAKEYLDNKTQLYIIEFNNKILLLGSAGGSVSLLNEVSAAEDVTKIKEKADEYLAKYRLKQESQFDQELKSTYLKQGKKLVDSGNDVVKSIMNKFKKKDNDK